MIFKSSVVGGIFDRILNKNNVLVWCLILHLITFLWSVNTCNRFLTIISDRLVAICVLPHKHSLMLLNITHMHKNINRISLLSVWLQCMLMPTQCNGYRRTRVAGHYMWVLSRNQMVTSLLSTHLTDLFCKLNQLHAAHRLSPEIKSLWPGLETHRLLWNPKFHYNVHKSPPNHQILFVYSPF